MANSDKSKLIAEFDEIESTILELRSQQTAFDAQINGLDIPRWTQAAIASARGRTVLQEGKYGRTEAALTDEALHDSAFPEPREGDHTDRHDRA